MIWISHIPHDSIYAEFCICMLCTNTVIPQHFVKDSACLASCCVEHLPAQWRSGDCPWCWCVWRFNEWRERASGSCLQMRPESNTVRLPWNIKHVAAAFIIIEDSLAIQKLYKMQFTGPQFWNVFVWDELWQAITTDLFIYLNLFIYFILPISIFVERKNYWMQSKQKRNAVNFLNFLVCENTFEPQ